MCGTRFAIKAGSSNRLLPTELVKFKEQQVRNSGGTYQEPLTLRTFQQEDFLLQP